MDSTERPGSAADAHLLVDLVHAVLARHERPGWTVEPAPEWCRVRPPSTVARPHGWKLHVAATPLSAPLVLARSAELLVGHGCAFKFGTDIARVAALVDGRYDRAAAGKFITCYPRDDAQFRAVAADLHRATDGLPGPRILSDRQFEPGSLVHFRYGEFVAVRVFTDDGTFRTRMAGPDGTQIEDERRPWFSPPDWAGSPFPGPAVAAAAAPESVLLGGRFRVRGAIRHANKGGVYRALDERDGARVVVKQARAHVGSTLDGSDVRDLLRTEARMLDLLTPLGVAPAVVALFTEQDDLFLAEEELPGTPLSGWIRDLADGGTPAPPDAMAMAGRLVDLVSIVHSAGLVIRDFKPGNVMVGTAGAVKLIDAEFVAAAGEQCRAAGTPGFLAPEVWAAGRQGRRLTAAPQADLYSLGVTLFCALTALPAAWVSGQPAAPPSDADLEQVLARIAADHPVLDAFIPLIAGLAAAEPEHRWSLPRAQEYLEGMDSRAPRAGSGTTAPGLG
ncbi:hypothetical protein Pflav_052710 [Phytohabitans flavus]|uniref:non-specific serine/threonine protein kinase n=1 Tax=Phytohabitans flavus TaxID=1076124 RepID=A0A6F8XYQ1_9ACTN|nr:hypothetical protein [Phytohabitans flavus]BCB78861.1 hypothetical protein Pflav_052710 [Phytohabitans flavus]